MKSCHITILMVSIVLIGMSVLLTVDEMGVYLFGWKWPFVCILHNLLHAKCAFCGMSRSFAAMGHCQFEKAFAFHSLGPILYALVAIQIPYRIWALWLWPKRLPKKIRKITMYLVTALVSAIILNWLLYVGGLL